MILCYPRRVEKLCLFSQKLPTKWSYKTYRNPVTIGLRLMTSWMPVDLLCSTPLPGKHNWSLSRRHQKLGELPHFIRKENRNMKKNLIWNGNTPNALSAMSGILFITKYLNLSSWENAEKGRNVFLGGWRTRGLWEQPRKPSDAQEAEVMCPGICGRLWTLGTNVSQQGRTPISPPTVKTVLGSDC